MLARSQFIAQSFIHGVNHPNNVVLIVSLILYLLLIIIIILINLFLSK
jgi:hypothetical protein